MKYADRMGLLLIAISIIFAINPPPGRMLACVSMLLLAQLLFTFASEKKREE